MPALYSPEWVAAFNGAVEGLDISTLATGASLSAESGSFSVAYEVRGDTGNREAKGGRRVVLIVETGAARMTNESEETGAAAAGGAAPDADRVNVTVSLSAADAEALAAGELDPATALGQGKIQVRGDVAVLVAGQAVLAAAAAKLAKSPIDSSSE